MTSRKHPSASFSITVALVAVLVAYPLSLVPASWLVDRDVLSWKAMREFYNPVLFAIGKSPQPVQDAIIACCLLLPSPDEITGNSGGWWIKSDRYWRQYKR